MDEGLDAGSQIDLFVLDLAKAFDKVRLERLKSKLCRYGIGKRTAIECNVLFCLARGGGGGQGWHRGESTRLPPMWPGLDSRTRRHTWVEFVGSLLCSERFVFARPHWP